jgi:peroxiredoxin
LADFQRRKAEFDALDTPILALSADDQPEAWGTVEQLGPEFTVFYGLDPEATSRVIGCYTGMHEDRPHIQPAAFILGPDGKIVYAAFSSGKVGRLTASDALTIVNDLRK